jgi:hypothetical protein
MVLIVFASMAEPLMLGQEGASVRHLTYLSPHRVLHPHGGNCSSQEPRLNCSEHLLLEKKWSSDKNHSLA